LVSILHPAADDSGETEAPGQLKHDHGIGAYKNRTNVARSVVLKDGSPSKNAWHLIEATPPP
jgi:hypothetical protein